MDFVMVQGYGLEDWEIMSLRVPFLMEKKKKNRRSYFDSKDDNDTK